MKHSTLRSTFALAERIKEIQAQIREDGEEERLKNERRKKMMIPFKFELGTGLKDIITGFEGVAMGRTQYFTGCNHYGLISRTMTEKGKPDEWVWLDETRLIPSGKKQIVLGEIKPTSGPAPNPPEM